MCGRFTLATPQDELVEVFDVPPLDAVLVPRYNVAPGQDVLVVAQDRRGRRMGMLRWGLASRDGGERSSRHVNARAETVARTPAFRAAFRSRRCLVPADGFYEWRRSAGGKVPWLFRPAAGGVLALAAVWERGAFAVLTVDANADVAPVHHRMPVVVPPAGFAAWLDGDAPLDAAAALLRPLPAGALRAHQVSTRVNGVGEDDEGLVEPVRGR